MSKPALGRGLGELMSGQKVPANFPTGATSPTTPEPAAENVSATETATPQLEATPGVSTLLLGKTEAPKVETKNPFAEPTAQPKPALDLSFLKWVLIIADVLLIGSTSFFVLTKMKTAKLTFVDGTLCFVTIGFAACLGCIAFYLHRHE